ncbi:MAG: tetratricopeptide repeat protein [Gammaproteobacteria bacterium]
MDTLTTEEQQIAALKTWWKENGTSIVTGVILGLAVLFGAKAWFAYQDRMAETASLVYSGMMAGLERGDAEIVDEKAALLIADYGSTPYAAMAALALAKTRLEEGALEAARAHLQWVLDNTDIDFVRDTARLRLARVLVEEHDLDGAEALLAQVPAEGGFDALYSEVRGDIFLARGDTGKAYAAYEHALTVLPQESPARNLLQLKFDNIQPSAGTEEGAQ